VLTETFEAAELPTPVLEKVKLPPVELLCVDFEAVVEMVEPAN